MMRTWCGILLVIFTGNFLYASESRSARLDLPLDVSFMLTDKFGGNERMRGEFRLYDGKKKDWISLAAERRSDVLIFKGDGVEWEIKEAAGGNLFRLDCKLRNLRKEEAYLEPQIILELGRGKDDWFYEGFNLLKAGAKPLSRLGIKGKSLQHIGGSLNPPFPVAALIGSKKAVFLGQFQFDDTSYNAACYEPLEADTARIKFSQRHTVGADKATDVRFVMGSIPVRFGREENVVQAYYDAYPEMWQPVAHRDNPLLYGTHSHYRAWSGNPDPEQERRYFASIEWAYAPFKRSGEIYGHDELWDYKFDQKAPFPEFNMKMGGEIVDYTKMTASEFREKRRQIFLEKAQIFGYAFYSCPAWCEIKLAREKYPDAINNDTEGGSRKIISSWVMQHDTEIRVFPLGTTLGKVIRGDLRRIYRELKVPGFAFDCGTPGVYYRGPAVSNPDLPGRAWDEKGIFIDELVAINELIDFVHELNPENPPVLWKNGPGRADRTMIEASIFRPDFRSWMPLTRYNIGMRPAVIHGHGYLINDTIPNWRNLSRDEFYEQLSKLGDHLVLSDFRYGFTEADRSYNGNPLALYTLPELLELVQLGWQALVPVEAESQGRFLYRARYGQKADTVLFYGNPWPEPMAMTFKVENSALDYGKTIFFVRKMRDQASLRNEICKGDTVFSASLPSRRPVLFEAVCSLADVPDGLNAEVSSEKNLERIRYTMKLDNSNAFRTVIVPRFIRNFTCRSILVNGQEVGGGEVLIPPEAEVGLEYRSTVFQCPVSVITGFPYLEGFAIRIPVDANPEEIGQAEALKDYFRFTAEKKITPGVKISIIKSNSSSSIPEIQLSAGRGVELGIDGSDNIIRVRAAAGGLAAMRKELARVMDRKFEYFFPFAITRKNITGEMLRKFDMTSRLLPFDRCFENNFGVTQ